MRLQLSYLASVHNVRLHSAYKNLLHHYGKKHRSIAIMPSYKTVVFVDIPDPDNILMILQTLRCYSKRKVAIVVSPRIVDLSVPRYGPDFVTILKKVGLTKMAIPIQDEQPHEVPEEVAHWFHKDADLNDNEVKRDTMLYMRLSVLRITECLQARGINPQKYTIFWDEQSLQKMKRPDMRHAFHVHDFKYNFNQAEMKEYNRITATYRSRGWDLRKRLRRVCTRYINRISAELALDKGEEILNNMEALLVANKRAKNAALLVGGPFTELLTYLKWAPQPAIITAMAGSFKSDRNIFNGVQFNLWKDMESAKAVFEHVVEKKIRLDIIPTECAKGKGEGRSCPYVLDMSEYKDILGADSLEFRTIEQYVEDKGGVSYEAFDWVTAVAVTNCRIFRWHTVVHKPLKEGEKTINISFRLAGSQSSSISMAKDDYEYMESKRQELIEGMKKIVED